MMMVITTSLVLEQRYSLQEFPALTIFSFLLHCQNMTGRSELSGKCMVFWSCLHKLGDTDSAGDAEEYKWESETVIFACALFTLLVLVTNRQSMV